MFIGLLRSEKLYSDAGVEAFADSVAIPVGRDATIPIGKTRKDIAKRTNTNFDFLFIFKPSIFQVEMIGVLLQPTILP